MSWATISRRLADVCIEQVGNDVTINGVSGRGILKSPSESIYDGVVVVTDWMVELPISVWVWWQKARRSLLMGSCFWHGSRAGCSGWI
jgi:hypothetical protein